MTSTVFSNYFIIQILISFPLGLPSDIKYFLDCGANDVLLKPLDVEAFGLAMKVITNGASQC